MKVITTADKFRVTEGQLVWLYWCGQTPSVRKVGYISSGTAHLVDPTEDTCSVIVGGNAIRIFHPETGLRACDAPLGDIELIPA